MTTRHFLSYSIIGFFLALLWSTPIHARPDSFSPIVKSEKEKVVHIGILSTTKTPKNMENPYFKQFKRQGPPKQRQWALGSGFIVSAEGYIVTNYHVVAKADKIEVTLFNGVKYKANIIGKDKTTELALLKIDAKNLPYTNWGDSSAMEVGDWAIAIGNPLGLDHTVTAGIISARGRSVFGGTAYGQFLQTDAAINFGNSGGPLFNVNGEVIGINTAIIAGGQNLGFAIPSNMAKKVISQLKKYGKIQRGWLGVEIQEVNTELAESFRMPDGMLGVVLVGIGNGSPAEKAGLQKGDVIVQFNETPLQKSTQLQQLVAETSPGKDAEVKIFRRGQFIIKTVTVSLRSTEQLASLDEKPSLYGIRLTVISPEIRAVLKIKENYGLLVDNIDQAGIAWEKGIRMNDVILEANNIKLKDIEVFNRSVKNTGKLKKPISLLIIRNGRSLYLTLPII